MSDLQARAHRYGIETEFHDARGTLRTVGPETVEVILQSLPPPPEHHLVDGALVMRAGKAGVSGLRRGFDGPVDVAIVREAADGPHEVARTRAESWSFAAADFEPGIYRATLVDAHGRTDAAPLIVAPVCSYGGSFDRGWVLAAQLYGVRSRTNWGIGDFGDLERLVRLAAEAGAAGVGLNPLHVLFDDHPADCSPYSPSSRLFLNPIYIDVSRAPGFSADDVAALGARLDVVRRTDLVDYPAVAELKWSSLRAAFIRFAQSGSSAETDEFAAFRRARAPTLQRFAAFEVLRRRFAGPWWQWPDDWRQPDDTRLRLLRDGDTAAQLSFFEYLQWVADRQLRACRDLARDRGMAVGLYLDVAVGVKMDGFDAWSSQDGIARGLSLGAPPDLLNTAGQDWGIATFSAAGLERTGYRPLRDMLAAVMRYAGAIRLDHVLGLRRLYLVPSGARADAGAYARMPFDAMLAVIAIESEAHRCVVIGEDLGTVPPGLRERLAEDGLWCYRVMLFERDHEGRFLPPEHYASDALVTFSTHDLPTFAGWSSGEDLRVKRGLRLDPGESDHDRAFALQRFAEATSTGSNQGRLDAMVDYLARTPSRILSVALEDVLGVAEQPNVPGTINEYPNWRRRMPVDLEDLGASPTIARLSAILRHRGRGGGA